MDHFGVYPPGTSPKAVQQNTQAAVEFDPFFGDSGDPTFPTKSMHMRLATDIPSERLSVSVQIHNGPQMGLTPDSATVVVPTGPLGSDPDCFVRMNAVDDGVWAVLFELEGGGDPPGGPWQIIVSIKPDPNDPISDRYVTFVVADSDDLTRQPWIDIPDGIVVPAARIGETQEGRATITNRGTVQCEITWPTDLGGGFRATPDTMTLAPNGNQQLTVTFTPPGPGGEATATAKPTVVNPPDPITRNGQVTVTATTLMPPQFADPGHQFEPPSATAGTATKVTLHGRFFSTSPPLTVTFFNSVAPPPQIIDDNTVLVEVPPGLPTGIPLPITAANQVGSATSTDQFTLTVFKPPPPPDSFPSRCQLCAENIRNHDYFSRHGAQICEVCHHPRNRHTPELPPF